MSSYRLLGSLPDLRIDHGGPTARLAVLELADVGTHLQDDVYTRVAHLSTGSRSLW